MTNVNNISYNLLNSHTKLKDYLDHYNGTNSISLQINNAKNINNVKHNNNNNNHNYERNNNNNYISSDITFNTGNPRSMSTHTQTRDKKTTNLFNEDNKNTIIRKRYNLNYLYIT